MRYGEDESGHGSWHEAVTPEDAAASESGVDLATMRGRPPQWYPDPLAPDTYHRWWTGTGWSSHTHPPGGPQLPEAHTRTTRPARAPRRLLAAAAVVVLALFVLVVGPHLTGSSEQVPPASGPAASATSAPPSTPISSGRTGSTGSTGAARPVTTGWLLVPGLPAQARTVCAAGEAADGGPSSTAAIRCTFQSATQSGTVTCGPDADQPSGAVTTCTVTDELSDRSSRSTCAATAAGLTCTPVQRLEILSR